MSKIKRGADAEDDLQENEELNPFSYKEFIRSKEQHTSSAEASDDKCHLTKKKTYVSAYLPERDCSLPSKGLNQNQLGHSFIDHIPQAHTEIDEPEEEWIGSYQPLVNEEAQKLREENAELRKHMKKLLKKSEIDDQRIRHLTEELQNKKVQEEREAKALETMVQSVEQNLQLMTKRAMKAENTVTKLKQEIHQLQDQLEGYRGERAVMNAMKRNAHVASEYLSKATRDAETSIKQLLTGAETLCLVSQMLNSIDKITENIVET